MLWPIYEILAVVLIAAQVLFLVLMFSNHRYVIKKAPKERTSYTPTVLLTVPCKGIDRAFDRNISSLYKLEYPDYVLHFVVETDADPAFAELQRIKEANLAGSHVKDVRILTSGTADKCSQKIHNLLFSCKNAPEGTEVFAFADSDACLGKNWLGHIVYPLRKEKNGASTGYRWFVPERNNFSTLALSSINAKVAQLLGNSHFNQAWGGSMAIKRQTFYDIGLDEIWSNALSDDLCLSWAIKKHGMKVVFVPACLVASYESMSFMQLAEFARRQFLITRVIMPKTWSFGLFSSAFSTLGVWGGAAVATTAAMTGHDQLKLFVAVPLVFLAGQMTRAYMRQRMIVKLLPNDADSMRVVRYADIFGTAIWSVLLLLAILSSAVGRTICWRGTRYKLVSPTQTEICKP